MHIVEMSAIRLCITEYKSEQMLPWASATNDFNDNPSLRTHQYFLCIEHTETFNYYLHKKDPGGFLCSNPSTLNISFCPI